MCVGNERNVSKVNVKLKHFFSPFDNNNDYRSVAKQFLEQIGTVSTESKRFAESFVNRIHRIGNSITLNAITISVHYALDLLRNLEKVMAMFRIDRIKVDLFS